MDDQYECFKQEIILILREHADDILEAYEKLKDELREAIASGVAAFAEIKALIYDCIERIERQKANRRAREHPDRQIIQPLLLDKRMKVHRCRSNC